MTIFTPAFRSLRSTPGFSLLGIGTLGLAIAANTAIFSVSDQLVLHPVSMPDPASLVAIWITNPKNGIQAPAISLPRYQELEGRIHAFKTSAASAFDSFTLTREGRATQLNGLRVTASFLPTLGVLPALGRSFTTAEDVPNGPAVCIISHELWRTEFGGRESLVGETIQLNGTGWLVIGVMPPRLTVPFSQVQIFAPRLQDTGGLTPAQIQIGATFASAFARLAPGSTLAEAQAELAAANPGYRERHRGNLDAQAPMDARPFVASLVSGVAPTMYTLLGAVGCVLLIACANVASLFLSRLLKRRKEIAIRMSLGATRGAVVRQFLAESVIFSAVAGVFGVILAVWTLDALGPILASQLPPNTTLTLNWRAVLFAGAISLIGALLTGTVPALQASRSQLTEQLNDSARGSSSAHGTRFRQGLIVAEVMLSIVLLIGAGLLLSTFVSLQHATLGFEPKGAASSFVGLPTARYTTPQQQADFYERTVEQLAAQPGVVNAAVAFNTPLNGGVRTPYGVLGRPPAPIPERPLAIFNVVSETYFSALDIPLAQGRAFSRDDRLTAPLVCIVNQTFASHVFPGEAAVGKTLLFGGNDRHVDVVGVIHDVKSVGVNVPVADEVYFPLRQLPRPGMNIVARTTGPASTLERPIAAAVAAVDPSQAASFFTMMETTVGNSVGPQRLVAALTAIFAGIALLLSITGLYSVVAYTVSQRTPEIGIRMALGATRRQVVGLIMRGGLMLVGAGVIGGLVGAAAASRLIRQLLFGIEPVSPWVYGTAALAFSAVAALACLVPSLRASRIDPVIAFRGD